MTLAKPAATGGRASHDHNAMKRCTAEVGVVVGAARRRGTTAARA